MLALALPPALASLRRSDQNGPFSGFPIYYGLATNGPEYTPIVDCLLITPGSRYEKSDLKWPSASSLAIPCQATGLSRT